MGCDSQFDGLYDREEKFSVDTNKSYGVNEIFYSLQGEGGRAGEASIFVRFRGCNMACDIEPGPKSPGGFACDTEFVSGKGMTLPEILEEVSKYNCKWLVLTGGEPGLQVDDNFVRFFNSQGYLLAIETNGTVTLPEGLAWITLSPKVAEHAVKLKHATEVKYVRSKGQEIPIPSCGSELRYISPAFSGHGLSQENLEWCIDLVKRHPEWRLSVQSHKIWSVR